MVIAVLAVLFSGFIIVLARITNARLAQRRGIPFSSLMNYITGLSGSLLVFLLTGSAMRTAFPAQGVSITIYLGGAMGLLSVYLMNLITEKLPAVQLTLLLFVGQLFSGILLDFFLTHMFSPGKFFGGLLVLLGLFINIQADRKRK